MGFEAIVRQGKRYLPVVLLILLLIGLGYWVNPRRQPTKTDLPQPSASETPIVLTPIAPLPQHPQIRVVFNHSQEQVYTDPYRQIKRYGYDLEDFVVQAIQGSRQSVDIAAQELNLPRIAQALVAAHQRGVRVRFITENSYNRDWSQAPAAGQGSGSSSSQSGGNSEEQDYGEEREAAKLDEYRHLIDLDGDGTLSDSELNERDVYRVLTRGQVPYLDDTADGTKGSGLMHHKFLVIDEQQVVAGSANFTLSDIHGDFGVANSSGNANHLLKLDSPELAAIFQEEFNQLWGDGPGAEPNSVFGVKKLERPIQRVTVGDATVAVHFSPSTRRVSFEESTNGLIASALNQAQKRVDVALFVFSDQAISDVLEVLHDQRQVEVRGLFDPGFAYRDYSRTLDMWGVTLPGKNCKFDPTRRPWTNPAQSVGIPKLAKTDKLHHKFGVVDGSIVITGSHNWTAAANRNNDENLLVIRSPIVAAHFTREFDRLLEGARLGVPSFLKQQIAENGQDCGAPPAPQPLEPLSLVDPFATPAPPPPALPAPASIPSAPAPIAPNLEVPATAPGANQPATGSGLVNLNTATAEELATLPGIGPTTAALIIQGRPYQSLEDLDRVKGIGPSKIEKLRDQVSW